MAGRRALERGISLAEALVIMAVAATMFAMAVPVVQNADDTGSAVRMVVSDAMRARSHAQRAWESTTMQVDVNNHRWRTLQQDGTPLMGHNADANGWIDLPSGVRFEQIGQTPTDLVFLPNGRAQQDAAVLVRKSDSRWEVRADALTGRISADRVEDAP